MPKNVIITGANGFVGKHLVLELIQHKYNILSIYGKNNKLSSDPFLNIDLTNKKEVHKINFSNITGVIHLAGLAAVGPSFHDPMKYINNNISMQCNLFEEAIQQNCRPRFLIISSGGLYNAVNSLPLTEESAVIPSSPYAVSKIGQEELSKYYIRRGFDSLIARPFNHCGPGQGTGFIVADLAQQIVSVEKGLNKKILVGDLRAKRDYTDVRDIVKAYRLLLEKGLSNNTYNVCSGRSYSGNEILDKLLKMSSIKPVIQIDSTKIRPSDIPEIYGNSQKLQKNTGWKPILRLEETLQDTLNYWRNLI